jgi:hypothetical protein
MDLFRFLFKEGPASCIIGSISSVFHVDIGTAKTAAKNPLVVKVMPVSNITEAIRDHQPLRKYRCNHMFVFQVT